MFVEWNDRALAFVERQPETYQSARGDTRTKTHASLVGIVCWRKLLARLTFFHLTETAGPFGPFHLTETAGPFGLFHMTETAGPFGPFHLTKTAGTFRHFIPVESHDRQKSECIKQMECSNILSKQGLIGFTVVNIFVVLKKYPRLYYRL